MNMSGVDYIFRNLIFQLFENFDDLNFNFRRGVWHYLHAEKRGSLQHCRKEQHLQWKEASLAPDTCEGTVCRATTWAHFNNECDEPRRRGPGRIGLRLPQRGTLYVSCPPRHRDVALLPPTASRTDCIEGTIHLEP